MLKIHQIEIAGLIFNGVKNEESEQYIENYSKVKVLGRIPKMSILNNETINKASAYITL
ncbi:hypothetical protein D3C87_2140990 [compost metagenome]